MAEHRPPAVAINPRPLVRNTLLGFVDIELASGLILRGCTVHKKRSHAWVGLPARPFKSANGKFWLPCVDFANTAARARFQTIALAAAAEHFPELAATEEEPTHEE